MDLPLIIEPIESPATSSIIILHGLGANKYDFQPIADYLKHKLPNTRFILPQAPNKKITINAGHEMPAWFDIKSLENEKDVNTADLNESSQQVIKLIEQQKQQGIKTENIVIAGFSQGGAVVYDAAFNHYSEKLAGVLALSSYGPTIVEGIKITDNRKQTPTLIIHGTHDNILSLELGQKTYDRLKNAKANVQWVDYPMAHQVIEEEIYYIEKWLKDLLIKNQ